MSLQGKVAVVTGGSRGIGSAIALGLAKKGARVAITYVSDSSRSKADDIVKQINDIHGAPGNAIAIQADLGKIESSEIIVNETIKGLQTDTIHILINNAGRSSNSYLGEITLEHYDDMYNVNVRGVIFLTQAVVPYLPRKDGRIVNVSSICATAGMVSQTVYASSKAAIDGLTKVWARELGEKYRCTVNAINPGPVTTDMFNSNDPEFEKYIFRRWGPSVENRRGDVQDIADIVSFLVSEEARWVTGDVVCANGGAL